MFQASLKQSMSWTVACVVVGSLVVGCDSGPPTAPVQGRVTYDGKPVPRGTIRFYPVGGGATAVGQIASDGAYTLARKVPGDDVLLGEYKVVIEAKEIVDSPARPMTFEDELTMAVGAPKNPPKSLVPLKYASIQTSDLTATVEAGANQIDFDLK